MAYGDAQCRVQVSLMWQCMPYVPYWCDNACRTCRTGVAMHVVRAVLVWQCMPYLPYCLRVERGIATMATGGRAAVKLEGADRGLCQSTLVSRA